ncbi:hypothetical protein A9Q87_04265 [Flavobacteriales bacterium 34_180_T64]|nr:hypothetical protein A9Q87_04265 [Flavobacteriales bacterium 34_180_T64]
MNFNDYNYNYGTVSMICALFLLLFSATAQNNQTHDSLINSYEKYSKLPREVVYVHLNKSTYIKGEAIGFSAYVLDKDTKTPSALTTNLYCTISDKNNTIIKQKLIRVEKGISNNVFHVDSLFNSGNYTFKAYTNWMRNFDEQNLFVETINVIDPETETFVKPKLLPNNLDAQFLPEGGHLVADIKSNIGIVIKNSDGFGVGNVEGEIVDKSDQFVTNFKTNALGIGRFVLMPLLHETYTVKIKHRNKDFEFSINNIKPNGVTLALSDLGKNVALSFKTNMQSLKNINQKTFKLAIHNGEVIKVTDVKFEDLENIKLISYADLSTGINIFTLFDNNNNPLLERLFFKFEGIKILKSGEGVVTKTYDSLRVKIPVQKLTTAHNFSVSVLPENTKAYQRHHTIISYTYLQPYVSGYIENAAYYFTDINRKKKYELDNLLITQGWSSYRWNTIFLNPPTNNYPFENGIGFKANINVKKSNQFLLFALKANKGDVFALGDNENMFLKSGLYPTENETINIGEIDTKGRMDEPNMYLQFVPSKIPNYTRRFALINNKTPALTEHTQIQPFTESVLNNTQQLDEVYIEAKREQLRTERLQKQTRGNVEIFDDRTRLHNRSLAQYLSKKGFVANDHQGILSISIRNPLTPNNSTPLVYLDGIQLVDFSFLAKFDMNTVDYIIINRGGLGEGLRGGAGVIKIYTDPNVIYTTQYGTNYKAFDVPLTFSKQKSFYAPKYSYYKSQFFKSYGVIGWTPNCSVDENGNLIFSVFDTNTPHLKLFIEGITQDGQFLVEEKTISLN